MRLNATAIVILAVLLGSGGPAAAQLEGQTIRVGIAGPLTGSAATFGVEMRQAVELAIQERQAAGGLLGASVASEVVNDEANAARGRAVAQALCDNPDILAVVGHVNSGVTIAASEIYQGCGLAMITPMSSNPAVTDRGLPNVFRLTSRDDVKGPGLAAYLYRVQGKRAAVVLDDQTAYGKGLADLFAARFGTLGGIVLARTGFKIGDTDFRPLLRSLPGTFDVLFCGGIGECTLILKQMREVGLSQLFACGDGCWDARGFIQPAGDAVRQGEGAVVLSAAPAVGRVPGSREFANRYTRQYGPIANYAASSYDSARLVLTAIEQAARARNGRPTRAEVLAALRALRFQGIAYGRPVEWDAKGDNRAAVIFVNVIEGDHFKEIAEIGPDQSGK